MIIHCFRVRSVSLRAFGIFLGYVVEIKIGSDDMSRTRMTTKPFLLLALTPFVMSDSDYPSISCPLCKSKTLWIIFMLLGRNVEQGQTTCRV